MWSRASQDEPLGTETTCQPQLPLSQDTRLFLPPCILPPETFCFLLPPQCQAEQQPCPFWPQDRAVPTSHGQDKPGQEWAAGEASALLQNEQTLKTLGKEKAATGSGIP